MKQVIFYCDVCKKEASVVGKELDVIFTTEQTEGRSCTPHLSREKIEICVKCLDKILEGNYLFASGAQGFNEYYFKEKK